MKRLSIRLSIVAAVLALGSSAIAYKMLSQPGDVAAPEAEQSLAAAETSAPAPTAPIRTEGEQSTESSPTLQPPPRSAFEPGNSLRTVSHESEPPATEQEDIQEIANAAEMIPTADPTDANLTYNASFPLAASSDNSATPPAPTYGDAYPTSEPSGRSNAGLSDASPDSGAEGIASPVPGFAIDDRSEVGADTMGRSSQTGPTSASDVAAAPATNFAPQPPPLGRGGTLGLPVAADETGGDENGESPSTDPLATSRTADSGYVIGEGQGRGSSPATGPGKSPVGAATGLAASLPGATPAAGRPLSGSAVPPSSRYPSTNSANLSSSGTQTYASPVANSYNTSPPAAALSAAGEYAPGLSTSEDPATGVSVPSYPPGSLGSPAAGGDSNATSSAGAALTPTPDMPGERHLEGEQSPAILLEKLAPEEIQVDRPATFQVRLRNAGNAAAHHVIVIDRVPRGTQFVDAVPPATPTADGTLVWQLETVKPGEEVVLSMNLLPKVAGEIGSVAQATFQAQASVRAICTKPELTLEVSIPDEILIGQPASLEITVTNTGNGAAEKVVIEEDVPEGFTHAAGRQLEHELGTLRPQESRRLTLVLDSAKAGSYENHLSVRGEGNLFDEDIQKIAVTSPQLQLAMQGPTLRYLDRQATYAVHLANPGTAPARNVELVTHLPKGMKYVTSDNQGQYDTQSHAVYWSLEELPADKQGDVHFTVLPIEPGNHKLKTNGSADLGLKQVCEHEVAVEGLAELAFTVSDVADPIEVGSDTAYEICIQNKGSKADTDIQVVAELPSGVTPTTGDGPTQGTVQGQRVFFGPLARLGPNEEAVFKIHAHGDVTGDHVIRVQLRSAELRVPVTKEEITRVYSDK